ncbi:MAG: PQQ-dependent catabolism-associated CXXCW motif protein [Alphaproteobacteria bacterium]|nr:PQQ-dependent catabolism-associated CXXCW motif protein [Alphaproteobacteria bacterium]
MVVAFGSASGAVAGAKPKFDEATGYRISRYRAALPDTVPGGKRVSTEEVEKLARDGLTVLIDVMPSYGPGFDPKSGQWRMTRPRLNIPGSTWLPDVGLGKLPAILERYFAQNLDRLTAGDKTKPLLFYCQSDCWMAWNATKRAASMGYTTLYWYPEGTDGWSDWDNETVLSQPVRVAVEGGDER